MTTLVLNQIPRFPAHVSATNGLTAVVDNGVDVIISPAFGDLVPVPAVTNSSSTYFMAWDKDIDYYQSISFQDFASNLADNVLQGSLLAIKNVTFAANQGVYFSDANTANAYSLSTFVRGISGSADAPTFRTAIGLGNVDNTSDANKPVSTAQQTALNLKADLASPTFTGDPKAPTPTAGDNDTSIATTAFVTNAVSTKANTASPTFTGDPKAPTPTAGDNDTSIATTAFVATAIANISAGFVSSQQIYANNSAVTVAHGLGSKPRKVRARLVCLTAEGGYSVGDEIHMESWYAFTSQSVAVTLSANATSLTFSVLLQINVSPKSGTGGTAITLTPANWRVILEADL